MLLAVVLNYVRFDAGSVFDPPICRPNVSSFSSEVTSRRHFVNGESTHLELHEQITLCKMKLHGKTPSGDEYVDEMPK